MKISTISLLTFVAAIAVSLSSRALAADEKEPATRAIPKVEPPAASAASAKSGHAKTSEDLLKLTQGTLGFERRLAAVWNALEGTPATDLERLAGELAALEKHFSDAVELRAVLARWADLHPGQAAQWVEKMTDWRRGDFRRIALDAWCQKDFAAAAKYCRALPDEQARREAMTSLVEALSELDPKKGYEQWLQLDAESKRRSALRMINRLAEVDSVAAYAAAKPLASQDNFSTVMYGVFKHWSRVDVAQALAAAGEISDEKQKSSAYGVVLAAMARKDPAKAFATWKALPQSSRSLDSVDGVIRIWMERDCPAAAKAAEELPPDRRSVIVRVVASHWAGKDAAAALAWIARLPENEREVLYVELPASLKGNVAAGLEAWKNVPPGRRLQAISNMAAVFEGGNAAQALQWLDSLKSEPERIGALQAFLRNGTLGREASKSLIEKLPAGKERNQGIAHSMGNYGESDSQGMITFLKSLQPIDRIAALDAYPNSALCTFDPEGMAEVLGPAPGAKRDYNALMEKAVAAALAKMDPRKAIAWAISLEPGEAQKLASAEAFKVFAASDGAAAIAEAKKLRPEAYKQGCLEAALSEWAATQPEAALSWAESATAEDGDFVMLKAVKGLAATDPAKAGGLLQSLLEKAAAIKNDSQKYKTLDKLTSPARELAAQWFETDRAAVFTWAMSLPDGGVKIDVMQCLTYLWHRRNPAAAAGWAKAMPEGLVKDNALTTLAGLMAADHPATAMELAVMINSEDSRNRAVWEAAYSWKQKDPKAARAALEAAPISEKRKQDYLKSFK